MRLNLSSILKRLKTNIQRPATQGLFTKVPNPKKPVNAVAGLTAAAVTTTVIASNKNTDEKEKLTPAKAKAHEDFQYHVTGFNCPELVESAKVLGFYGCHSDGERKFFRGEKLSKNKIDELEKQLDTLLELKKNTPITSETDVAKKFSNPPFLEYISDVVLINIIGIKSRDTKRTPVLYEINIPKDFKFIKIPNGKYRDPAYENEEYFNESEYVIPMGSLIKVTKSDTYDADSEQRHYTINVLENPNP